ncbi:spore cortex biosynthesis protein YabQ [Thalassobacillus pellis]|uniref:spore cortex biosynthesis protein YabQ n=1 Tax=Thalassobacillus pellis TaxID=748008 RepID=UPI00195F7834|nr:spore cortex biosynthesis protein YabQ [Thalassobacillus pellis]MBM7555137.1 spore cortex biosynthesis protein YabQ [Thalassobacillus pellis]
MTLTTQFLAIISMIAGGIYLGAAIDTLKRFEKWYRKRTLMNYAIVISFWLLQVFMLFFLLYQVNYGELRLYIFLAVLCGYAGYKGLFQHVYVRVLEWWIRMVKGLIKFFSRCFQMFIVTPFQWIWKVTFGLLKWVSGILLAGMLLIVRVIWWPLRLVFLLIWKLIPENMKKYLHTAAGFCCKIKNRIISWWKLLRR